MSRIKDIVDPAGLLLQVSRISRKSRKSMKSRQSRKLWISKKSRLSQQFRYSMSLGVSFRLAFDEMIKSKELNDIENHYDFQYH